MRIGGNVGGNVGGGETGGVTAAGGAATGEVTAGGAAIVTVSAGEASDWAALSTQNRPWQCGQFTYPPAFLFGTRSRALHRGHSRLIAIMIIANWLLQIANCKLDESGCATEYVIHCSIADIDFFSESRENKGRKTIVFCSFCNLHFAICN
jgi:hypothetical protein